MMLYQSKFLLHRANTPAEWGFAAENGFGGIEVDVYFRKGKFWLGHPYLPLGFPFGPPLPRARIPLDSFLQWLKKYPQMRALIEIKTWRTFRHLRKLYTVLHAGSLAKQCIVFSSVLVYGVPPPEKNIGIARFVINPHRDYFLPYMNAFIFGWLPNGPRWMQWLSRKFIFNRLNQNEWRYFLEKYRDKISIFTGPTNPKTLEQLLNGYIPLNTIDYIVAPRSLLRRYGFKHIPGKDKVEFILSPQKTRE